MRSTLQAIKTYLWGWNVGTFCSTNTGFRDIRLRENRKCTEWPQTEVEHLTVKVLCIHIIISPEAQIVVRFALRLAVYEIQYVQLSLAKIGIAPNNLNLNLKLLTVKGTLYTLNTYLWRPNFGPFCSTISRFRDTTPTRSAKIGDASNDTKLNLNF